MVALTLYVGCYCDAGRILYFCIQITNSHGNNTIFFTGRFFLSDAVLADPLTKCFVHSSYSTA